VTDPIGKHLTGLPAAWQPVTLRQLLNHTSGIPSYTGSPRWRPRMGERMSPDTIALITAIDTMDFAPGAKWSYNNTGYVLLGMLLERKLGRPYAELLRTELTGPLGLTSVRYCDDADTTAATVARGYDRSPSGFARATYLHMSQPFSAGAMCATAGDIARWSGLLATGRVVRPESYRAMTTPEGAARTAPFKYGFGLGVDTLVGHPIVTHGGGINGFISASAYFPGDSLAVTVFSNATPSEPDRLLRNVARAVFGLPLDGPPRPVTLTAAERAQYVGSYAVQLPGRVLPMRIFEQGDKLISQAEGQGPIELIPYGNHTFGAAFDPSVRLIFAIDGGRAAKFTLRQGGGSFEAPRVP
jgi:D-alanyl-D-alanine carboxypeptidase